MAVCTKCGEKLDSKAKFCTKCGTPVGEKTTVTTASTESNQDTKVFKILSYIGILWLIGLFCQHKNDSKVKFHVGQGIILSIISFALSVVVNLVNTLIIYKIFRTEVTFFGYGTGQYQISGLGLAISGMLTFASSACIIALAIIGIVNVCKDQDKELPIIGKYAFYK